MSRCPECDMLFELIWHRGYETPEYCPFCGLEIDYKELTNEDQTQ